MQCIWKKYAMIIKIFVVHTTDNLYFYRIFICVMLSWPLANFMAFEYMTKGFLCLFIQFRFVYCAFLFHWSPGVLVRLLLWMQVLRENCYWKMESDWDAVTTIELANRKIPSMANNNDRMSRICWAKNFVTKNKWISERIFVVVVVVKKLFNVAMMRRKKNNPKSEKKWKCSAIYDPQNWINWKHAQRYKRQLFKYWIPF